MVVSKGLGYVFALLSMFFNGTHPVMFKLSSVQNARVSPLIFNFYFSIGACLSSLIVYIVLAGMGEKVEYSAYGIGSGACLVLACGFSFMAVQHIGLARGQGVWSGSAIIVSFFAGCIVQGFPSNPFIRALGIVALLIGVVGAAFCKTVAEWICPTPIKLFREVEPLNQSLLQTPSYDPDLEPIEDTKNPVLGLVSALSVGLFGGTIGLWTLANGIPDGASGIKWIPSFASGVAITAPLSLLLPYFIEGELRWNLRAGLLPGIIGGFIWNGANITSLYAIDALTYSVAYPIMQSALIVAALWGVVIFGELKGCRVLSVLGFSAALVIGGAVLLCV